MSKEQEHQSLVQLPANSQELAGPFSAHLICSVLRVTFKFPAWLDASFTKCSQ